MITVIVSGGERYWIYENCFNVDINHIGLLCFTCKDQQYEVMNNYQIITDIK